MAAEQPGEGLPRRKVRATHSAERKRRHPHPSPSATPSPHGRGKEACLNQPHLGRVRDGAFLHQRRLRRVEMRRLGLACRKQAGRHRRRRARSSCRRHRLPPESPASPRAFPRRRDAARGCGPPAVRSNLRRAARQEAARRRKLRHRNSPARSCRWRRPQSSAAHRADPQEGRDRSTRRPVPAQGSEAPTRQPRESFETSPRGAQPLATLYI